MLLNKKHKKGLQILWVIVGILTILGMVLLYVPGLIF